MRRGGERGEPGLMWKQCGKKQQRIEEEARSPVVSLEYVNRRRHPDPSFDELSVNRIVTNCSNCTNEDMIFI